MSETIQELMENEIEEEDDDDEDESYKEEQEEDEDESDESDEWSDEDENDDSPIEEDLTSPLFAAVVTGDVTVVQSLPKPLDLLQRSNFGSTPLYIAARHGHLDIVRYFVELGKQPQMCNSCLSLPILVIIAGRNTVFTTTVLPVILSYVDAVNFDGQSPLHIAAKQGHLSVVQYLVDQGSFITTWFHHHYQFHDRMNITSFSTITTLTLFTINIANDSHIIQSLHPNPSCFPLVFLSFLPLFCSFAVAVAVVFSGADKEQTDSDSRDSTPLWVAAMNGHVDVVRYLAEKGAKLQVQSTELPL